MAGTLIRLTLLLPLGLGLCRAAVGEVADPTKPPSAAATAVASSAGQDTAGEMVLQSVYLPKTGKASAWISGERIMLGGKIGDDKVVRITEGEVVLRGPGGEKHLLLVPAVNMTPTKVVPAKGRREK